MISTAYNNVFPPAGGVTLKRVGGSSEWSERMPVNGNTHIRWWCRSTTGNWLDPGTWRIEELILGANCVGDWDQGYIESCEPTGSISISSSERGAWTAERSRCASSATQSISARLGRNRRLTIKCHSDPPTVRAYQGLRNRQVVAIKPAHSGLCLDIEFGDSQNSRKLQQYNCNNGRNQRFLLKKKGANYEIRPLSSGLCVDVEYGDNVNGRLAQQIRCHNGPNQRFRLIRKGSQFEVRTVSSNLCWDVKAGSRSSGAKVQQFACHNGSNQRFYVIPAQ